MSTLYHSSQFEVGGHARTAKHWQLSPQKAQSPTRDVGKGVPAQYERPETAGYAGRHISPREPTSFVVDANGHVLSHLKKSSPLRESGSAFSPKSPRGSGTHTARWPDQSGLSTNPSPPKAGMGYKGIESKYMRSNTVTLSTECNTTNTR